MPRCPICDYSTDTPVQSTYFLSLPASERGKKRRQFTNSRGEVTVGCADCFLPKSVVEKEEDNE